MKWLSYIKCKSLSSTYAEEKSLYWRWEMYAGRENSNISHNNAGENIQHVGSSFHFAPLCTPPHPPFFTYSPGTESLADWICVFPSLQEYIPVLPGISDLPVLASLIPPLLLPFALISPLSPPVCQNKVCCLQSRDGFAEGYLRCFLSPGIRLDPANWRTIWLIAAPPCRQGTKSEAGQRESLSVCLHGFALKGYQRIWVKYGTQTAPGYIHQSRTSSCCFLTITSTNSSLPDFVQQQWRVDVAGFNLHIYFWLLDMVTDVFSVEEMFGKHSTEWILIFWLPRQGSFVFNLQFLFMFISRFVISNITHKREREREQSTLKTFNLGHTISFL